MFDIKNKRLENNMTQVELAQKLNVKQSTLSNWENNKIAPKSERLPDIAESLGCLVDDLFSKETNVTDETA